MRVESRYGFGDAQIWNHLKRLAAAKEPVVIISEKSASEGARRQNHFLDASVDLTDSGRAILAGKSDFVEINGIDLWLGGVHLKDETRVWRWDEDRSLLVS